MKKQRIVILAIVLVAIAAIALAVNGVLTRVSANLEALKDMEIAKIDLNTIQDGVYSGSYSAFPVSVEVNVTVKAHRITSIEIMRHDNGQGAPAEAIPGKVVEAQSLQVDSVSGATYSSRVILKAIEGALLSANPA